MTDGADRNGGADVPDVPGAPEDPEAVSGPTLPPRHGFWAWLVFILAVGAVLALAGGCMAYMYRPLFGG
ncbi:hypothetical protein [Nocardiopsis suaedae]|uniref:Uncharacterized protein n=1 Tax=Nocardiopsis suaedae TaxID=3018444 RepID=A0ABT4TG90_9ACTN|nr:hypothetical protein [Nocardiopsis suaedae]MDA2803127.1 hypothetical protein [Nocardiopsis suaedae]